MSKITRLSAEVREELNCRLYQGQTGRQVLKWLNGLPGTGQMLAAQYNGHPISHSNLTHWRAGGYQKWLVQKQMLPADESGGRRHADRLASILTTRYADLLQDWSGEVTDEFKRKFRIFHELSHGVVQLQRSDLRGEQLDLKGERLQWERKCAGDFKSV